MKHLFNGINVYMIMLYGTDCKYITCSSCVLGEKSRLKWSGEASLKKLDLIWIFKDRLDLNWLWVRKEAALSGRKKMSKSKRVKPQGQLSPISTCS